MPYKDTPKERSCVNVKPGEGYFYRPSAARYELTPHTSGDTLRPLGALYVNLRTALRMAITVGFEPTTRWLTANRSTN